MTDSSIELTSVKLWIILLLVVQVRLLLAAYMAVSKLNTLGPSVAPRLNVDFIFVALGQEGVCIVVQNFLLSPSFTKHLCKNLFVEDVEMCKKHGPLWGYTYTEVYTLLFPVGVYPAAAAVIALYAWPASEGLDVSLRVAILIADGTIILVWVAWCYSGALLQIIFLQKLCDLLRIQTNFAK